MQVQLTTATVDLDTGRVERAGGAVEILTTLERKALAYLVARAPAEVSHEELLREVWGYAPGVESRAPYFTVRRLRARIEPDAVPPRHLLTVHGVGYRFVPGEGAASQPTPGPAPERRTNLSIPSVRLIGRGDLLPSIVAALAAPGWVTLVGPAGAGKTLLARHVGRELLRAGQTVWFCDLSEAETPSDLVGHVARVLDVNLAQAGDPVERVGLAMGSRGDMVLVLDNLEQLVPAASGVLKAWREGAPDARILVTSRVRLRAEGERVIQVDPLRPADAVEQLRERSLAGGRRLPDDPATTEILARLVEGVDRLPLLLELAAARLAVVGPETLERKLADPLAVLNHGPIDGPVRHRSVRDAIGSSWSRLSDEGRRALAACSVFAGGFWLEEAERVLAGDDVDAMWVLDQLQDLHERSLIQAAEVDEVPGDVRFSLLVSVRSFAAEQLAAAPERATVALRHASAYASLAERLEPRIEAGFPSALPRLRLEMANLRSAFQRADDPAVAARIGVVLDVLLRTNAPPGERRRVADRTVALAGSSGDPRTIARARLVRAVVVHGTAERPAEDLAMVERIATELDDRVLLCRAALAEGHDHLGRGESAAAAAPLARARAIAESLDDDVLHERVLQVVLHHALDTGAFERCPEIAQALVALRRRGALDRLPIANLGVWYERSGDRVAMKAAMEADLQLHRRTGDRHREALVLINLGVDELEHDLERSRVRLAAAVQLAREVGNTVYEALGRYNLAVAIMALGDLEGGLREAELAADAARRIGHNRYAALIGYLRAMAMLTLGRVPEALAEAERAAAHAEQAGDAFLIAWNRLGMAAARAMAGDLPGAEAVFARGEAWLAASPLAERMKRLVGLHRAIVWACGAGEERDAARTVLAGCAHERGASTRLVRGVISYALERRS